MKVKSATNIFQSVYNPSLFFWFFTIIIILYAVLSPSSLLTYIYILDVALLLSAIIFLAYHYPVLTVCLWICANLIMYAILGEQGVLKFGFAYGALDFLPHDLFTFGMAATIILRLFQKNYNLIKILKESLPLALLILIIIFSVVRNIGIYKHAAPAELRYFAQNLVPFPYIICSFENKKNLMRLFKWLLIIGFAGLFIFIFRVIYLGFPSPPETRHLPSISHLGIVFSVCAVAVFYMNGLLKLSFLIRLFLFSTALMVILFDGHRSVWLAGGMAIIFLALLGYIRLKFIARYFFPLLCTTLVLLLIFNAILPDARVYFSERGTAFSNFKEDSTAYWRYLIWVNVVKDTIQNNPLLGEGFGGYYDIYIPETNATVTVSLHNLYTGLFMKMGAAGLLTYLLFAYWLFRQFYRRRVKADSNASRAFADFGLLVLLVSHVYYIPYSFDGYTWTWLGLAYTFVLSNSMSPHNKKIISK